MSPRSPRRPPGQRGRKPGSDNRPPKPGWQSRLAAAQILYLVLDEGLELDEALLQCDTFDALDGSDRGFARAIASAALRALGRIDRMLGGFLDRPLAKLDPAVRALLRCGCAQMFVMQSPAYAVVSATVDAARQWPEARRGGGLVNAILRRCDREKDSWAALPATSIWPDWLATRFKSALGEDRATALADLQMNDPNVDLTVKSDPAGWAEKLSGEPLANGSVRLASPGALTDLPGFADGDWWVQDVAASLAAPLMGDIKDNHVADLCAAPGGKTLQLAAAGAHVAALDIAEDRLARVAENLDRTGLKAELIAADAADWRPEQPLDAVLLDAPCSALGTLRRHPDGAWKRSPKNLDRYAKTQTRLIKAAHDMLKPGGTLVYCVCTPLPAEGEDIIAAALATGDWTAAPIQPTEVPGFDAALMPDGWLLTAPVPEKNIPACDVFFVARLQKA